MANEKKKVLRAYHGSMEIKIKYVERMARHRELDQIRKGVYWDDAQLFDSSDQRSIKVGCAVGCTIHSSAHDRYERALGIPEVLAHLEDSIFEMLDDEQMIRDFPLAFLEAIQPGADLSRVVVDLWDSLRESLSVNGYDEGQVHRETTVMRDGGRDVFASYTIGAITDFADSNRKRQDMVISQLLLLLREAPIIREARR